MIICNYFLYQLEKIDSKMYYLFFSHKFVFHTYRLQLNLNLNSFLNNYLFSIRIISTQQEPLTKLNYNAICFLNNS
jgi:hypothetical protein